VPGFQSVYREYRDRGFVVVGLSADQGGEGAVRDVVRQYGITYPVAMAPRSVMRLYGGIDLLPQSFLIDRQGKVRKMVTGVFSEAQLRRNLDQLLSKGAP
jgi:peroxiredoxin